MTCVTGGEVDVRDAIVAKERETTVLRRVAVVLMLAGVIAACLQPGGRLVWYFAAAAYAFAIMAPVGWLCLRRYAMHALEMMLADPAYFVREHRVPRWGSPFPPLGDDLWLGQMPGYWLSIAGLTTILPPILMAAILRASPSASAVLLFAALFGLGLQALLEGAVWRRYGRRALRDQTGIDAESLMVERGYRWTPWWGWRSL